LISEPIVARPEVALAAVIYLMTRYQRQPCPAVARAIADHLTRLSGQGGIDDCIRCLCTRLKDEWDQRAVGRLIPFEGEAIH